MNPVLILIPAIIAVVLFFVFKSSKKKEDLKPNVVPQPNDPVLEVTSSFVDSSFVAEASPAPEVLFEKLPEVAPVEAPMEVQAEAPKPKAKPKAKKTVAKKKSAAKK